jgi:hypothetical protein
VTRPVPTEDQCLLCGADALTYADLCDRCAGVVLECADRVAASMVTVIDGPAGAAVIRIAGQLELDDQ